MTKHVHVVRVGYVDTDQAGVVHHATYLRYLEAARVELMRDAGITYKKFELEGKQALPVVEANLKYKRPARFDDELRIETECAFVNRAKVRFDSTIYRGDEVLTKAEITLVCIHWPEGTLKSMAHEIVALGPKTT